MQQINNEPLEKYILIDTTLRPSYSKVKSVKLTQEEALIKNFAYGMNRSKYRYVKASEWQ
tara:strand:- start:226 stop:405 length:180 start_codon:yes stop_codon:yes gene_type:complete